MVVVSSLLPSRQLSSCGEPLSLVHYTGRPNSDWWAETLAAHDRYTRVRSTPLPSLARPREGHRSEFLCLCEATWHPRLLVRASPRAPAGGTRRVSWWRQPRSALRGPCCEFDPGRRGIERPRRGPSTRAERRHRERADDDDAERPCCDHGSQPKSSHLSLACSAGP